MINNKQQELKDLMAKTQKYELLMRRPIMELQNSRIEQEILF